MNNPGDHQTGVGKQWANDDEDSIDLNALVGAVLAVPVTAVAINVVVAARAHDDEHPGLASASVEDGSSPG